MERLPKGSPEPDLDGERERRSGANGTSRDGKVGSVCIRLTRSLLQRERYSVILDKESGAAPHHAQKHNRLLDVIEPTLNGIGHKCFREECDSDGVKKRKERPPKDSRPKEKRFRHGGRKGRRTPRKGNRAH